MRPALIVVALLVAGSLLLGLTGRAQEPTSPTAGLKLEVPLTVAAGSAFDAVVTGAPATNAPVRLVLINSYGARVYEGTATAGSATIRVPESETTVAGFVTAVATVNGVSTQSTLTIEPGAPVEPLQPLVGARTLVADGNHWSMVIAIPMDIYGNPVAKGTDVRLRAVHPNGWDDDLITQTGPLLAWRKVYSGTIAGVTRVTVQSGNAYGPEGVIEEVAGWPVPFTLQSSLSQIPADGQSQVILRTSVIADQYGNVMPDGTLVTFVARDAEGEQRSSAVTIGGVAETPLRAPAQPSDISVYAMVYDIQSEPITVIASDGPAVGAIYVIATLDAAAGEIAIDAGPVLGPLGDYVPDGTVVDIRVVSGGKTVLTPATVADGHAMATVRLAELPGATALVEVTAGSGSGSTTISTATGETVTPQASPVASPVPVS